MSLLRTKVFLELDVEISETDVEGDLAFYLSHPMLSDSLQLRCHNVAMADMVLGNLERESLENLPESKINPISEVVSSILSMKESLSDIAKTIKK